MAKNKPEETAENQNANSAEVAKEKVFQTVVSGAEFHDFDLQPQFVGEYTGRKVIREKDGTGNQKAGDIMGFIFTDGNGEEVIIGSSHTIAKSVEDGKIKEGDIARITFLGKGVTTAGTQFNRFKIEVAK